MNPSPEIEIRFIRLNTGEDIVTEVQKINDKTLRIINPLKIVYYYNEHAGVMSMSLVPWIFVRITESDHYDMDLHNILVSSRLSIPMTQTYYGIIKKFNDSMFNKEGISQEEGEDDFDADFDDDEIKETKEMLNDIIKKRYH